MIAFVRSVTAASTEAGSSWNVVASISAKSTAMPSMCL